MNPYKRIWSDPETDPYQWDRMFSSDAYIRASGGTPAVDMLPEPGLIDVSGLSAIPVANAYRGLKGIQLAKGKKLAQKISWAKERERNIANAKIFASGSALVGSDLHEVINTDTGKNQINSFSLIM